MNDAHIEYSHIYKDEIFGKKQIDSIFILHKVLRKLKDENKKYITSILIDNVNILQSKWNIDYLIKNIKEYEVEPDIIAFEESFINIANEIIDRIPQKYKKDVLFFYDGQNKFALKDTYSNYEKHKCVILSCAWLLCKLGLIKYPINSLVIKNKELVLQSQSIISILQNEYKPVEENVMKIIFSMGLENQKDRIQYIFY
jgi:hypothetical protein